MSVEGWSGKRYCDEVVWYAMKYGDEPDVKADPETKKTVRERFDSYLKELSKMKGSKKGVMPHASFYCAVARRSFSGSDYSKSDCIAEIKEGYVYRITNKALLKAIREAFPFIKTGIPGLIGVYTDRQIPNKPKHVIVDLNSGFAFDNTFNKLDRIRLNERNELTNTNEVLRVVKKTLERVKTSKSPLEKTIAIAKAHPKRTVQAMDEIARRAGEKKGMTGLRVDGDVKEAIRWFSERAKIHSIEDMTVALALYPVRDPEETERFIQAWNNKRNDGPFEELTETFGYPLFRDQLLSVMKRQLNITDENAWALADGIAKKTTEARDELYRHKEVPKKDLDNLWKHAARVKDRRWLRHYATLIYEAVWLLQNGKGEYFAEHPIVFGGILTGERKDDKQ